MTKVITDTGLTIEIKSKEGSVYPKGNCSIELDDTKPIEEQLKWAREAALKGWELSSDIVGEKVNEEELMKDPVKRGMVITALKNHKLRLDSLEAKIKELEKNSTSDK